jgi:hypothetical protein
VDIACPINFTIHEEAAAPGIVIYKKEPHLLPQKAVRLWPLGDIPFTPLNVRFLGIADIAPYSATTPLVSAQLGTHWPQAA